MVETHDIQHSTTATKIYKIAFWMRKYGSMSWKRTWLWSNSKSVAKLDMGAMIAAEKALAKPTTTKYKDKTGKTKFKGNSSLKTSQTLVFIGLEYVLY